MQIPLQTCSNDLTNAILDLTTLIKLCSIDLSVDNFRHHMNYNIDPTQADKVM